jgi:hypothetical protein
VPSAGFLPDLYAEAGGLLLPIVWVANFLFAVIMTIYAYRTEIVDFFRYLVACSLKESRPDLATNHPALFVGT